MQVKPNQTTSKKVFPLLSEFIQITQPEEDTINKIAKINQFSSCWKNIIIYNELDFHNCFPNISRTDTPKLSLLSLNFTLISTKATLNCFSFGDAGFFERTSIESSRKELLSELNKEKEKLRKLLNEIDTEIYQISSLCSQFSLPSIKYTNSLSIIDFELEPSVSNTDWPNRFQAYVDEITKSIDSFTQASELADTQLDFFKKGKFDVSIVEIKEKEIAEKQEREHLEKLNQRSVVIDFNGEKGTLTIDWQNAENFPVKIDSIREIISNGVFWLVLDRDNEVYISGNAEEWHNLCSNAEKIKCIDGLLYIFSENDCFTTLYKEGEVTFIHHHRY